MRVGAARVDGCHAVKTCHFGPHLIFSNAIETGFRATPARGVVGARVVGVLTRVRKKWLVPRDSTTYNSTAVMQVPWGRRGA